MKPTTEIAEELVHKVENAEEMLGTSSEDITAVVNREIPLLELLEVARAAKELSTIGIYGDVLKTIPAMEHMKKTISKLREKLPEI